MSTAVFYRHHRSLEGQDLRNTESPGMASRLHHSQAMCARGHQEQQVPHLYNEDDEASCAEMNLEL